jgi:anaerobic selenocysteine-containing dehydrogenase
MRLNVPSPYIPFASGGFGTADGQCNLWGAEHSDSHPRYTPPHEDPRLRPDLADRYPLQMVSPPEPSFLNSSFANVASLKAIAGSPRLLIHPLDATPRGIANGQMVRVFNDRGSFDARAEVAEKSRAGVVVAPGIWWSKDTTDGANANSTTSTQLTDMGGGATFFDNLVEVAPITPGTTRS